jgi:hypothetical protein
MRNGACCNVSNLTTAQIQTAELDLFTMGAMITLSLTVANEAYGPLRCNPPRQQDDVTSALIPLETPSPLVREA